MERWPPWLTLVLISVSTLCQDSKAQLQSAFTIDWVKLTLLPNITVEHGTNVTLRCEAKVSHSYSQLIHTFTFMLDSNVIYSKNSSEAVVERSLTPARASNSGNYKCRVNIHNKKRTSNFQKLTVEGLQPPQLKVRPDVVYEGDEISATCSAPEETGSLYFYFYNNGQELPVPSSTNSVTTTIEVKERENYLHCNYRLVMQFREVFSNNSNTVKVIVQDYNITSSIRIRPDKNVVEGDRVYVSCNVSGYPQTDLEIFLIKNNLLHYGHASFTYSFDATVKDSGEYVCKVETGKVQKISTDKLVVAELFSMPVLSMTPEQVFEGQSFSLSCSSSMKFQQRINHTDVKYTLYKNQHPLKTGQIFKYTATQATNGNYTCMAEAKGIKKNSKQLIINVKVPVSTPVIRTVGEVIVKRPFQILCESMQGTLPINYTLLKSQSQLSQKTTTGPLRRALFNITSINQKDEIHSFKCQAENGAGNSELSQALTSAVKEPVSKPKLTLSPEDHTVTEKKNVTLFCSVKEGTVPVTFSWYRKGTTQPLFLKPFNHTKGEYEISSFKREFRGTYYCEAFNDANETKRSDDVSITVNLAGWKKVVIAVICILILVLIVTILVLFLKKTGAPRKRKRAVDLSVKSARPKSNDPMRMSLTLDIEDNTAFNSSPGVMGRNVWSEDVSDSENEDPSREEESKELQYTEMNPQQTVDDEEAPMQESVAMNGEVQDCTQGATDEGASDSAVEYVQLNHGEPDPE
ncbi:platelet endothelial cell adhesion molecule [Colossoma macropomum]|uniref:platelet endothelial cell adhesion molecule n=1 Tax=Colossoma macropomum TaxID=42526 RepID=UPI001863D908|nr:platelet endothelial cell adhesion molecule [Colossoma macropomum]